MTTKLIVFGPTGKSGLAVIDTALQNKNIQVTLFIRSPHKLPDHFKSKVSSIIGDIYDEESVCKAVQGQDIVVCCLGKGYNLLFPTTVISIGIKNIVSGMRTHNVKKLITISICSLLPTYGKKPPAILKNLTDDHERALSFLKEVNDIDWIGFLTEVCGLVLESDLENIVTQLNTIDVLTTFFKTETGLEKDSRRPSSRYVQEKQRTVEDSSRTPQRYSMPL